jgi:hypothetical protein
MKMQRPARPFPPRLSVPLIAWLVAGCVEIEPEPEPELATAEASCGACVSPPLVDWTRGGADPEELFPRDVRHLQVLVMPADDRSFIAWGVGGGEVLWLYRVQMGDRDNILAAIAGAATVHNDASLGSSVGVAGSFRGNPPAPPGPPGQPPFSPEVVAIVVESAAAHEQVNEQTYEQLSGL